jgi:hypothetical protein
MGDDEGNPFSFKTFVKRTGVDGGAKGGVKKEGGRKSKRPSAATQDAGSVPFPEGSTPGSTSDSALPLAIIRGFFH